MTPNIRPARPEDWPSIRALLEARDLPVAGAEAHLRLSLVATDATSSVIVGVAGVERYAEDGLVRSVAVTTEEAGTGLGTALVRALLQRAREEGLRALYLLTTTADRWFPRFGFIVVRREDLPEALSASEELRGACPSTAVAMALQLRPTHPNL